MRLMELGTLPTFARNKFIPPFTILYREKTPPIYENDNEDHLVLGYLFAGYCNTRVCS